VFISHAWDYKSEYDGVVNLLNADSTFKWVDLSVPVDDPLPVYMALPKSYRCLVRQLDERIQQTDCLLVLAAMYVAHRGWIQSEIEAAMDFNKPIIAVKPRGQERVPEALRQAAITDPVGWNKESIISAIRKYSVPTPAWPSVFGRMSPSPPPLVNRLVSPPSPPMPMPPSPPPPRITSTLADLATIIGLIPFPPKK
jgi:hypothetical protein